MSCNTYELVIQECDDSGEPSHWLVLDASTPIQVRKLGEVVWVGEVAEIAEKIERQADEIERLRTLAEGAVVAYHIRAHSSVYSECQEPFCREAKALGLPIATQAAKEKNDG